MLAIGGFAIFAVQALATGAAIATVPTVLLNNSADPNVWMPVVGFGTGGYTGNASIPYGTYPVRKVVVRCKLTSYSCNIGASPSIPLIPPARRSASMDASTPSVSRLIRPTSAAARSMWML